MNTSRIGVRLVALAVAATVALAGFAVLKTETASAYTPPPMKVGLVRSQVTADWCSRHTSYRGYGILYKQDAVYNYLKQRGWDVSYVSDASLSSITTLRQYDVIVLPWVFAMDFAPSKTLLQYANEGGGLVSFFGPRVAPQYEVNRASTSEVVPEHWVTALQHEGWEWGPLSEVWQSVFIDDLGAIGFHAAPTSHSIVSSAKSILSSRGSTSDGSLERPSSDPAWIELVRTVRNNYNSKAILTWTFPSGWKNPANGKAYSGTFPAAVANEYGAGRAVDFFFAPADFLTTYDTVHSRWVHGGATMGEVAGAYFEAAISWAGAQHTAAGTIARRGLTYASINVYQDGIYASQYLTAGGNVTVGGTLRFRVYDPAGKLVYKSERYKMGIEPGETRRYSHSYVTSKLADGKYRVETEYQFSHTNGYADTMKSVAYVVRGQGTGIGTLPAGGASPNVSGVGSSMNPVSPNADRVMDSTYLRFTTDRPSLVTVEVLNGAGQVVAKPLVNALRAAGSSGVSYAPTVSDGRYSVRVTARNSYGARSLSSVFYVSRSISKMTALGGTPRLSSVAPSPNPFTPNGDRVDDAAYFKFTLSAPAYVSVRVVDWRGEVKKVLDDAQYKAGTYSGRWNGTNDAGSGMPSGTYAYYVFAHSGGTTPATSLVSGTVRLSR